MTPPKCELTDDGPIILARPRRVQASITQLLAGARDFWQRSAMARLVVFYAIALALAVMGLEWLQYRYLTRAFSTEIYIVLLATAFAGLGLWAGHRLTRRRAPQPGFARNDAAIRSLGLTPRECEILDLLASGRSTKEIARQLGISPNTAKTHLARVYQKLEVQRRIQAIHKARELALIP
jgi:DNA-binding CsgD family transcriptional regulator